MSAPLFIEPTAATAPALASAAGSSAGFVADFIQVAAGVHAVDLNAILRPLVCACAAPSRDCMAGVFSIRRLGRQRDRERNEAFR